MAQFGAALSRAGNLAISNRPREQSFAFAFASQSWRNAKLAQRNADAKRDSGTEFYLRSFP
ncbi:hypothetical protein CYANOKiyG1_75530 [Okeania sp. KiyG1]|nr:hypothetical protein CYANOKiyG1_75530 [Okeania sp. KiyG1]